MVGETAQPETAASGGLDRPVAGALPSLLVPLSPPAILERCEEAAKRGRLAGFERRAPAGTLFSVECPGTPFEGWLDARAEPAGADRTRLVFSTRLKPLWVWGFAAVLALSVWPGVVLTEGLVASLVPGSFWKWTWYWYIPLTLPFAPLAWWQAVKMSRAGVSAEAAATIDKLATELGATREG